MKNLTIEVSLKPFYGLDDNATRSVCAEALGQWRALVRHAEQVSILFWASDGSEILEYAGDLDAPMEWARYIGNGNAHVHPTIAADPEGRSLHARSYLYRPDAPPLTYRRLAAIAQAWREALAAIGKPSHIGLAFDPGGEFAPSDFKYKRHREICLADTMGKASFVCCYGILNAEMHAYAAFPDGIPQGTSFGTFLGRQFRALARDAGLDYIWFSNGFGFGMETWMTAGPLFDGEKFSPEKATETRDRILQFWKDFRKECPDFGIETRGTNLGTATDLASDATPLRELYEGGFDFVPPPNSPWAALNGDFGIELAGYMSRIAELPPGQEARFRFYLHDPWWLNSPWLDRYERQPHDIYLPLAVGRVDSEGRTRGAQTMSLLTIDDSYGRMPETVPNESIPHLLRAWNERPDAAGPIVWLYPFDELHDAMFGDSPSPERLFHNDWCVREMLNDGLPVNTVMSTRTLAALGPRALEVLAGRILLAPTPLDTEAEKQLLTWVDGGGDLLLYGPLDAAPILRERLGLAAAEPLSGPFDVVCDLPLLDEFQTGEAARTFEHRPLMSGGSLTECALPGHQPSAVAVRDGDRRALVAGFQTAAGGRVHWLRAPLPLTMKKGDHLPAPDNRASIFSFTELARQVLGDWGWQVGVHAVNREQRRPVLTLHRHDNGWFFSGYMPDTTVETSLGTPWRLDCLDDETAFVGIGYSIDSGAARGNHVLLGCSHLYSARGEGLQFRLGRIEAPIMRGRNPFMSEDDARRTGETIRQLFFDAKMRLPMRVVVHKRTPFTNEEQRGLLQGLEGVPNVELIEVTIEESLRYLASKMSNGKPEIDKFPVPRGAVVILNNTSALLWVHGVTPNAMNPNWKYYQGKRRIPTPLLIRRYRGQSDITQVATEILGLSKMNWNTFDYYSRLPATLDSASAIAKVGAYLSGFSSAPYDYRLLI